MVVVATLPARIVSSGLVARTSKCSLQKSVGSVRSQISSSTRILEKDRQGRVNGGLALSERRRENVGGRMVRKDDCESASPDKTEEDRPRPRVT
jgi:hypothetical protein